MKTACLVTLFYVALAHLLASYQFAAAQQPVDIGAPVRLGAPVHLMIPAYGNPCCDGGREMWRDLIKTAQDPDRQFELHVVFNPASGPGLKRDVNYLTSSGTGVIRDIRSNGVRIYGYVSTDYGKRSEPEIARDIDGYLKDASLYLGCVDGIFFDEVSTDLAKVPQHRRLVKYVKSFDPTMVTVGNAGVTATMNPTKQSELSTEDYGSVFDVLMSFEHNAKTYGDAYEAPQYEASQDQASQYESSQHGGSKVKFAHVVHSLANWDPHWLKLAQQRGADFVFLTDAVYQVPTDNPYDRLPSYWEAMVAALNENAVAATSQ